MRISNIWSRKSESAQVESFTKRWQDKIDNLPTEFISKDGIVYVLKLDGKDSAIKISYLRYETVKEKESRRLNEARQVQLDKQEKERDIAEFTRLKAKLGR